MKIDACLTKNTDNWETPKEIYEYFCNLKGFFDPCPINANFDGLQIRWQQNNFVNPPYSKLKEWVEKSIAEMKKGKFIVMLIPSRTDTQAFKSLYEANAHITFIIGRLKFSNKNYAPFPSMLVFLQNTHTKAEFHIIERNLLYNTWQ